MAGSEDTLRSLIAERAIVRGPIKLSNGKVSAYYFDCKRVTLSADGAALVGDAVLAVLRELPERPQAIGGMTHGADPIIGAVMMRALQENQRLDGFYVRREPKKHGTRQPVENPPKRGAKVVIVDDVVTSGGSVIDAINGAEREGCEVIAVVTLVDRLEGGDQKIKARVPHYVPLYTLEAFPEIERIKQECTTKSEPLSAGVST